VVVRGLNLISLYARGVAHTKPGRQRSQEYVGEERRLADPSTPRLNCHAWVNQRRWPGHLFANRDEQVAEVDRRFGAEWG
jgi:hypothetical protein